MKKLFNIGGKERPVLFGSNALKEFEKLSGYSVLNGRAVTQELFSFTGIVNLVYVGLKWGLYDVDKATEPKPDFSILKVGDWIDEVGMGDGTVVADIFTFFLKSMPKAKEKNAGAGDNPA